MTQNKSLCSRVEFELLLRPDRLAGGDLESQPFLGCWATYGAYRVERVIQLEEIHLSSDGKVQSHHMKRRRFLDRKRFSNYGAEPEPEEVDEVQPEPVDTTEFVVEQQDPTLHYQTREAIVFDGFPAYDELREDCNFWLKLMTHSYQSGIPKIDENEAHNVRHEIQSGVCMLQIYELLSAAMGHLKEGVNKGTTDVTFVFSTSFSDPKLQMIKIGEICRAQGTDPNTLSKEALDQLNTEAFQHTYKALVNVQVTIRGFNVTNYKRSALSRSDLLKVNTNSTLAHLVALSTPTQKEHVQMANRHDGHSSSKRKGRYTEEEEEGRLYREDHRKQRFNPILYTSAHASERMITHINSLVSIYCASFITLGDTQSLYKPLNSNVSNLQLPYYISEQGMQPVAAYWTCHDPCTREYASPELREQDLRTYSFNDDTEKHFEMVAEAAFRRYGMTREAFTHTVTEHFDSKNKASVCSGLYLTALKAVADIGTCIGNSAYYTSDYRWVHIDEYSPLETEEGHPHATTTPKPTPHLSSSANGVRVRRITLDSFDNTILNGIANSDDCEGQDNLSTTPLRAFTFGRYDDYGGERGGWKSPLLTLIKQVVLNSVIFDVGSTVTSAYVDTNNKPINIRNQDLPFIGDAIDLASHCDGHCFSVMVPLAVTCDLLSAGNVSERVVEKVRLSAGRQQFNARDYTVPVLVLEGTGSIEPTVLPVKELYGRFPLQMRDQTVQYHFMKSLKQRLTTTTKKPVTIDGKQKLLVHHEISPLGKMFSGEGIEHYVESQPLERRVSSFYREVVHGVPVSLYMIDPTLSQVGFCKTRDGVTYYGMNMGELLRSGLSPQKKGSGEVLSLNAPFADSGAEWQKKAVPLMESIQNQMPIMAYGRYTAEQYSRTHSLVMNLKTGEFGPMTSAAQKREDIIRGCATSTEHTLIRLYSREWRLTKKKGELQQLLQFFRETPGFVTLSLYSVKCLPNCHAIVDMLIVVKTKDYLKSEESGPTSHKGHK